MKAKERLEELIRLFHEHQVVEKIATAENHYAEYNVQKEIYKQQGKELKKVIEAEGKACSHVFCETCKAMDCDYEAPIKKGYEILPEDSVQICVICMMYDLEISSIFEDQKEIKKALERVKGKFVCTATVMEQFLVRQSDFWTETEDKLINCFFAH